MTYIILKPYFYGETQTSFQWVNANNVLLENLAL